MRKRICRTALLSLTVLFAAASMTLPSFAQTTSPTPKTKATAPAAATSDVTSPAPKSKGAAPVAPAKLEAAVSTIQPVEAKVTADKATDAAMTAKMMELAKLSDNHKLLAGMAGTWTYTVKMWMNPDPKAPATSSTGSAVIKAIMDGRYFVGDFTGKMQMPGADGKMKDMQFKGMSIDGYDNVKQKFVSTWCDNMGTGVMMSEGTYDAASKTFTYTGEYEAMPGMKSKFRETVKIVDADHHNFEYFEDRGTGEMKSMEISYTRKK
ncbi:MAG TPA: DUF1579 domain-containing protein [Chthoniobacterales bacterium]